MTSKASLIALTATVLVVGVFFFRVIGPFLLPLLFAAILALLFHPLYMRAVALFRGHRRIAAAATTAIVLVGGILPIAVASFLAGQELIDVGRKLVENDLVELRQNPRLAGAWKRLEDYLSAEEMQELRKTSLSSLQDVIQRVYDKTQSLLANAVEFVAGFCVFALSLYYFFAEGPAMLAAVRRVSPMTADVEATLFRQFDKVCRGVVLATVVSALVQALLAGVGFAVAGVEHVWLLAGCTMIAAMIPILGSAAVWLPVAAWLFLDERPLAAVLLAVYGAAVVSTADNLIRIHVVNSQSHLHPLIVFITMLGAMRIAGLWGVFVGPIIAAFFYALLKILHERLDERYEGDEGERRPAAAASAWPTLERPAPVKPR